MGNQAAFDLVEALATCNSLPSVLDSLVSSLNTSVMEDNVENGMENVTISIKKNASKSSLQTCYKPMPNWL